MILSYRLYTLFYYLSDNSSIIELTLIYNTPNAFLHRKIDYFYIDFKLFTSYF